MRHSANPLSAVRAIALCAVVALASHLAWAQVEEGQITIELELVAGGLTAPVSVTHAGDGTGRLFVVDQAGTIRVIRDGVLLSEPFLDLTDDIVAVNPFFDERGVLGLAFHPDYASNGRFFVRYSVAREGGPDDPCFGSSRGCHAEVLGEFRVSDDPDVAEPGGTILFSVDEPQFNHDSGGIAFGPDGFLYFTLGDGGGANDGLADTPPSHGPIGNGQDIFTTLGSILRIDIDGGAPYAIPPGNPFVGLPGEDEIYAYGMRNPYRFSFDREDGRLFLGDVGQNLFEEVNIVEKGGNYGWVIREGFHCFDPFDPTNPPAACASAGPSGEPLLDPVAEYDHGDGIAIVGGFVYRGSRFRELRGKYVFGDFSRSFFPGNGRLFYLDADGDQSRIFELRLGNMNQPLGAYLLGLGEDEAGELYVTTSDNLGPGGDTGKVLHIGRLDLVTLCHVPPGNVANARTIVVSASSVSAHLVHGDHLGVCGGMGGVNEGSGSLVKFHQGSGRTQVPQPTIIPSATGLQLDRGDTETRSARPNRPESGSKR
jgi:glucose/arabinose dehydrogenase